ncbi:MAG: PcfJ domain-containing protein, partial [Anaerococcus vaginalis]|nr:PcfJ domain-containing protein [Anaerococcus vaginalis]
GKTTIVFIRRKEKPDMPYFTLEYRNQQVIQIQGKCNRQEVPEKIKQAVERWKQVAQTAISS